MKTKSVEGYPSPQAPSKGEVREVMSRILASKHFINAPTKQKFLQLLCDSYLTGRASELNEYMIGCEVYGRDANYNPALDPIVRVGAHGLRKRLEAYYKGVGKHDEIVLDIPTGSYVPAFNRRPNPLPEEIEPKKVIASASPPTYSPVDKHLKTLLTVTVIFLLITTLTLAYSNTQLRIQSIASAHSIEMNDAYKPVWGTFLKDGNPALLVLGNPSVYRFRHPTDPALSIRGAR